MTTGLNLTDEFVHQFQKLKDEYDQLQEGGGVAVAPVPVEPTVIHVPTPDPKTLQQVEYLTGEVGRLERALAEALSKVSEPPPQVDPPPVDTSREIAEAAQRKIEAVKAEATRRIQQLNSQIDQLNVEIEQLRSRPPIVTTGVGGSFKDAFPKEYEKVLKLNEQLQKLNETVFLYRKKYGPII